MERLESYLKEHFDVPAKHPSEEAQRRWRSAVGLVKNRRRRFRMVPDLDKRSEVETQRRNIQVRPSRSRPVRRTCTARIVKFVIKFVFDPRRKAVLVFS